VIATGGTFDKAYDPAKETLSFAEGSTIAHILHLAMVSDASTEVLLQVDSLDMNREDRAEIVEHIENVGAKRTVIVHGTTRMIDTAKYLEKVFSDRTIVLTGALRPYRYSATEASFNLGFAMASARVLKRGIYIAMSGTVFTPDTIEKDLETGRFRRKSDEKI